MRRNSVLLKAVLRDYINATIGFEELGDLTDKSPKSLMRMFGPRGNPQARNLFEIIDTLQKREAVHFEVRAVREVDEGLRVAHRAHFAQE